MTTDLRSLRRAAAHRYRPAAIQTLLVAEAPPAADDRYFYFDEVRSNDWLFMAISAGILGSKPARTGKPHALRQLQARGVYLIDLSEDPKTTKRALAQCVPDLVTRAKTLTPERIVLIKVNVYDLAYGPLCAAGLPVVDERIPFPSTGQQTNFRTAFQRALQAAGVSGRGSATALSRGPHSEP